MKVMDHWPVKEKGKGTRTIKYLVKWGGEKEPEKTSVYYASKP